MVLRVLAAFFLLASILSAEIGMGSTREQVIAEFGPPRGSTKAGHKEILTYPNGRVVLVLGQVSEMTMSPASAATTPATAAPAEAPAAPPKVATAPEAMAERSQALSQVMAAPAAKRANDPWLLDFEAAKATAAKENKRILILFTGTDWCGPCQEFQAQVAYNADFLKTFSPSFVFLKINWLRNTPQPPAEAEQTNRLRQQYGIASFPSLLVLAADGTQLTRVDTRKGRPASDTADYFIQAIDEARVATRDGQPVKSSWWPF
ncbi:MAG TPA: thioredoxin family protein [Opitutaceae bacterium]